MLGEFLSVADKLKRNREHAAYLITREAHIETLAAKALDELRVEEENTSVTANYNNWFNSIAAEYGVDVKRPVKATIVDECYGEMMARMYYSDATCKILDERHAAMPVSEEELTKNCNKVK